MQIDIRPAPASQLTDFIATSGLMLINLKWALPNPSDWYRGAQVWVNVINDRETATLAATVSGNTYSHEVSDVNMRYFWVRGINEYDRPDGIWTGPAAGVARRVGAGDLDAEAFIKSLSLKASSQVFAITKTGQTNPSSISLSAVAGSLEGDVEWTIVSGTVTLGGAANATVRSISPASMTTDAVTIRIDQDGLYDLMTIVKIREGADGTGTPGIAAVSGFLTNEAASLPSDSNGNVSSFSTAAGQFKVFDGITEKTGNAAVAYQIIGTSGATGTISTAGIYAVSTMPADQATITFRATYNGVQIDKVLALAKSKAGPAGAPGAASTVEGPAGSRGTFDIVVEGYGAWPTDHSTASTYFSNATGYWPINRDRMTLTNGVNASTRFYNNGSWLPIAAWINGNMVVDGTFSAAKISADEMTGQQYRTSANSTRVTLNESNDNMLKAYVNGTVAAAIGGSSSGYVYAKSTSSFMYGVYGENSGSGVGIYGTNSYTGTSTVTTVGGWFTAQTGIGVIAQSNSGTSLEIRGNTGFGIVQSSGNANWLRQILPATDNAYSLGGSGAFRWTALYATSSTITTSDARTKTNIRPCLLGLDFINALEPVTYKQVVAEYEVEDEEIDGEIFNTAYPRPGTRDHYGLIAQQVKTAMNSQGVVDAAFWSLSDPTDPESQQALRYEELIAPLIRAVQELSTQLNEVKAELTVLKANQP